MSLFPSIKAEKESNEIVKFLQKTLEVRNFSKLVIAVSGGIDSAATLFLAVKAIGVQNVHALLLPYAQLSKQSTQDGWLATQAAGLPQAQVTLFDISTMADVYFAQAGLKLDNKSDKFRIGNICARSRMIALYDHAKKFNALVLGTENKSEYLLSYFTRFGDEASDIEPIRHLYKTQIFELAKFLGVPQPILENPPTANLWKDQTDESEFGFTYKQADQILYALYDKKMDVNKLISMGFNQTDILKVKSWVEEHWFKHELPLVYK